MKTDFQISVEVNIGLTRELSAIVAAILANNPAAIEPQAVNTIPTEAATAPAVSEPQQAPEPAQAPAPASAAAKPLTAEDVRAAMHRARQRIEGEDYKDNTQSEAYKRYHRQLTAAVQEHRSAAGGRQAQRTA